MVADLFYRFRRTAIHSIKTAGGEAPVVVWNGARITCPDSAGNSTVVLLALRLKLVSAAAVSNNTLNDKE